jgi:hypothetical protein
MSSPSIARIRMTLPSIVIECNSTEAAAGDATRTSRSFDVPRFSIVA